MTDHRPCPAGGPGAGCPLYVESHMGSGTGCVDDLVLPCLVERGEMDFDAAWSPRRAPEASRK